MIETLRVKGLALLKDCEIGFGPGLTVISGETGAGKTVLLTSLRLVMGERAEGVLVDRGAKRTEIDCLAVVPPAELEELEEAGYAGEDDLVIFSRTVAKEGRSRAAIGGRPVPARRLSETLGRLVTLHGQADQWRLRDGAAQRRLLDDFAGERHQELLQDNLRAWETVVAAKEHYQELTEHHGQLLGELNYLKEDVERIVALDPVPGEEQELDQAIERLTNVGELREEVSSALQLIAGAQASLSELSGRAAQGLRRASRADSSLEPLASRAAGLEAESGALESDLRDYLDSLFDDPDELSRLLGRRADLTDLMRGKATDTEELLAWLADAQARIGELEGDGLNPAAAQQKLEEAQEQLLAQARLVSESRAKAARRLCDRVNQELKGLALKDARFSVQLEPTQPGRLGADRVTMMLQPHPKAPVAPLSQGASGGELSRVMLALEVALADRSGQHTFVFDEVDAGIGGSAAGAVASRLSDLARFAQVIVVTHQPVVAAMAETNLVVEKKDGKANVRAVEGEARTDEIVRMLGGDSGAARRLALELEQRGVQQSISE